MYQGTGGACSLKCVYMVDDLVRMGVVTSPHGVHGEVKVYPTTDTPERFETVGNVIVEQKGKQTLMDVENVKYFKGMVILKLSGIRTMDEAETYRQADLLVHKYQTPCEGGQYFICDLLDMEVVNEAGEKIGFVKDVLQTGANSVYVVEKPDGKELLLPVIPDCVKNVSLEERRITVFVMPGLED